MVSLFAKSLALAAALAQPLSPEIGSAQLLEVEEHKEIEGTCWTLIIWTWMGIDTVPDAVCEVVPMDDAGNAVG
jgi:hypothetical protein